MHQANVHLINSVIHLNISVGNCRSVSRAKLQVLKLVKMSSLIMLIKHMQTTSITVQNVGHSNERRPIQKVKYRLTGQCCRFHLMFGQLVNKQRILDRFIKFHNNKKERTRSDMSQTTGSRSSPPSLIRYLASE